MTENLLLAWADFCLWVTGHYYPMNFIEHLEDQFPAVGHYSQTPIEMLTGDAVLVLKMTYDATETRH